MHASGQTAPKQIPSKPTVANELARAFALAGQVQKFTLLVSARVAGTVPASCEKEGNLDDGSIIYSLQRLNSILAETGNDLERTTNALGEL